ncbi:BRI1 kinase inhibitor [Actinidia chinensis var. chinensis]|uniref:BRI1 kinase inhibitor n=1 Tax=Actinidia chinensis var. chinensis TaxID=1590841 RepID=A0A2R6RJU1_ACTCC|nr:BRI1 kinase inhibitor [Actinidia chinensis var. chinensis]
MGSELKDNKWTPKTTKRMDTGSSSKGKKPLESEGGKKSLEPEFGGFEMEVRVFMAQMLELMQTMLESTKPLHTKVDNEAFQLVFMERKLSELNKEVWKGKIPMEKDDSEEQEEKNEDEEQNKEAGNDKEEAEHKGGEGSDQEEEKNDDDDSSETESEASPAPICRTSQRINQLSKFSNTEDTAIELSLSPYLSPKSTPVHMSSPKFTPPRTTPPPSTSLLALE